MKKKQGVLVYDKETSRYKVRFDLSEYSSGLHCGECMDVRVKGRWISTRMEYLAGWYLVDVDTDVLDGLMVRM